MLSFISIIKCNSSIATYQVRMDHQNRYNAELIREIPATDTLPQRLSLDKYRLAQSASDASDLITRKIASAILLAESNLEDVA